MQEDSYQLATHSFVCLRSSKLASFTQFTLHEMEVELEALVYGFIIVLIVYIIAIHTVLFRKTQLTPSFVGNNLTVANSRSNSPNVHVPRPRKKPKRRKEKPKPNSRKKQDVQETTNVRVELSNPCQRLVAKLYYCTNKQNCMTRLFFKGSHKYFDNHTMKHFNYHTMYINCWPSIYLDLPASDPKSVIRLGIKIELS